MVVVVVVVEQRSKWIPMAMLLYDNYNMNLQHTYTTA